MKKAYLHIGFWVWLVRFCVPLFCMGIPIGAEVAVYEGFEGYAPGSDVYTQGEGHGFAGPWSMRAELLPGGRGLLSGPASEVREASLKYSDGTRELETRGGSLFITGENGSVHMAREVDLDALPHTGPDPKIGKTTYISFLARRSGEPADPNDPVYEGNYPYGKNLYPRVAGINFFAYNDDDILNLLFGNLSNKSDDVWRFTGEDLYGDDRRDARSSVPFGSGDKTDFVVIRIDHGSGGWHGDRFKVWINPKLASEKANAPPITFDWTTRDEPLYMQPGFIGIEAGDGDSQRPHAELAFDEFRLGDSWESVTPHTEGASWAEIPIVEDGFIATGRGYLGWLSLTDGPWAYSWTLESWIFLRESEVGSQGSWFYMNELN